MTYWENFKFNWDIYLGILTGFASTLMCYPAMVFQLDISEKIEKEYKFVCCCFVYNIGDILSRILHPFLPVNTRIRLHLSNVFKFLLVWVIYFLVHYPNHNIYYKFLCIFLVGFFQGIIILKYSLFGKKLLKSNPYDSNRMGHIVINMSYLGLFLGSVLAAILVK